MDRRLAIAGSLSLITYLPPLHALPQRTQEPPLEYKWKVPDVLAEQLRADLKHTGRIEHERGEKGLPVVAILIGAALLPIIVDSIMKLRARLTQPGLIIDTRQKVIQIETSSKVPKGYVLLVSKEGSNLIDSTQLKDSSELTKALATAVAK